jgi:hypothetical protein
MSTMNRRAVAIVLALIVVGAGTVILLLPQSLSSFHLEADYTGEGVDPIYLWLTDIQDCNLTVTFTDNPDLLYSIDIDLYEAAPSSSAFVLTVEEWFDIRFQAILSIKSLQVTLGTGVPYKIVVSGTDVNATFIYDNNVIGSGASLNYGATGSFISLNFTEDMVFSDTGMEVRVGATGEADIAYLHTDLPDGVNGEATFREPLSLHSVIGWVYRSGFLNEVTYSTDPLNTEPLLEIGIRAVYGVHVWLSD